MKRPKRPLKLFTKRISMSNWNVFFFRCTPSFDLLTHKACFSHTLRLLRVRWKLKPSAKLSDLERSQWSNELLSIWQINQWTERKWHHVMFFRAFCSSNMQPICCAYMCSPLAHKAWNETSQPNIKHLLRCRSFSVSFSNPLTSLMSHKSCSERYENRMLGWSYFFAFPTMFEARFALWCFVRGGSAPQDAFVLGPPQK